MAALVANTVLGKHLQIPCERVHRSAGSVFVSNKFGPGRSRRSTYYELLT